MLTDTFAHRLQIAMKKENLTPTELANESKLDKSLISNYLSGNYKPKQNRLIILAECLNVNELWLMGYDVQMSRDDNTTSYDENKILFEKI